MVEQNIISDFVEAIKQDPVERNTVHSAEVSRIDNEGTVWVRVAGSEKETPTASSAAEVKKGDAVNVEWRNNKLYIAGNYSNPSAGVFRVTNVENAAKVANQAASNAVADAGVARSAAESAQASATEAKTIAQGVSGIAERAERYAGEAKVAADTAFTNLSQVQSVLEVAEWIATHGTYTKATTFNPNATYYTITATQVASPSDDDKDSQGVLIYYELSSGVYVRTTDTSVQSGKTYYTVTGTPVAGAKAEDIGQYYTLAVSEAMADYIKSHLALTDEGLYVMQDRSDWKLLVANNGVYIIDPDGNPVNQMKFSQSITGKENSYHVNIDEDSIEFMNGEDLLGYIANSKLNFPIGEITKQFYVAEKYVWRQTPTRALGLYLR